MISVEDGNKRLDGIAELESDWDSYGAYPIPAAVIEKARAVIAQYPDYLQGVYPLPNGGVEIEWSFGQALSLEIELDESGNLKMDSMLIIRAYVCNENITDFELSQLYRFGTNRDQANRTYEANKRRAAARGEDVSKW